MNMKKALLFAGMLLCLMPMHVSADLRLESGSLSVLKNAGEYAYVEIDWSKSKVVEFDRQGKVEKTLGTIDAYNKSQGADWVKDWPEVKRFVVNCTAWEKRPGRANFNKKNKKGVLITVNPQIWKAYNNSKNEDERKELKDHCVWVNPSKAKYKLVLTVNQVDMGSGAASAFGVGVSTGGAIINGKICLIDLATGKQLANVSVNQCKGFGNYSQRTRLMDVVTGEIFGDLPDLIR
jgi:hypothetical protein